MKLSSLSHFKVLQKAYRFADVLLLGFSALTGDNSDEHEYAILASAALSVFDNIPRVASSLSQLTPPSPPIQTIPAERFKLRNLRIRVVPDPREDRFLPGVVSGVCMGTIFTLSGMRKASTATRGHLALGM